MRVPLPRDSDLTLPLWRLIIDVSRSIGAGRRMRVICADVASACQSAVDAQFDRTTTTSTGPLAPSCFSPSCSCSAVKNRRCSGISASEAMNGAPVGDAPAESGFRCVEQNEVEWSGEPCLIDNGAPQRL
jgi:hypothetical protein